MKSVKKGAASSRTAALCAAAALQLFALCVLRFPAHAGGPGSAGMQVLKTDMSPRAAGMGGAFVAVADDIYSLDYNPAGLGQLYMPEASAMYMAGFDDASLQHFSFGMPLPIRGLAGLSKPGAGISLLMSDAGKFNYQAIMPDGSVFSKSFTAQKDLALTFGYGEKVYSGEVNLEGYNAKIEQYLGVNAKYIRSTLLEDSTPPSTLAFDAGWLLLEPKLGLSLGASIANYGGGLKYASETTKLPSIIRLGAAYQHSTITDQSILLCAESDFYSSESLKSLRFGTEYQFEDIFKLRLGYKAAEDNKGFTLGFGLHYNDMSLDFAPGLANEVYNSSQLAFSYKFTGITVKEYRKKTAYKDPQPEGKPAARPAQAKPARKTPAAPAKKKDSDFFWIY